MSDPRAGYEAGAEDAGRGELLVETLDLWYALFDLDAKTKRATALGELAMAVQVETLEHEEDCRCGLCRALGAVGAAAAISRAPSQGRIPYDQSPCLPPMQVIE